MKLSEEQIQNAEKSLELLRPCAVCGVRDWTVDEELFEIVPIDRPSLFSLRLTIAALVVGCNRCSAMVFFNAVQLGIINEKGEPLP